jgi:predicted site-specific integrase-resolvase
MNTELVEAALSASGRRLVVLDDGEVADNLVRDMRSWPHAFTWAGSMRMSRPGGGPSRNDA